MFVASSFSYTNKNTTFIIMSGFQCGYRQQQQQLPLLSHGCIQ